MAFADYKILKIIEETENARHFIAEGKNGLFLLSGFYDREAVNLHITDITGISNEKCPSFSEWFSENSVLYTAFKYEKGTQIIKYLEKEPMPFKYRVAMLKSIVLKLVEADDFPFILQNAIIKPENIIVREGTLAFNYKMDMSDKRITRESLYSYFTELICEIFTNNEISKTHALKIISDKCGKCIYESSVEILRDIDSLLKQEEKECDLKTAIMEKNKNRVKAARKAAAVFCVVVAAGFLYYEFIVKTREGMPTFAPVTEIGNVHVEDVQAPDILTTEITETTIHIRESEKTAEPEKAQKPPANNEAADSSEKTDLVQKDDDEIYIVKRGDSLIKICAAHYGDPTMWRAVAEYNNLENPNFLRIGQTLSLPANRPQE